jgi:FkbM family methyltransferase
MTLRKLLNIILYHITRACYESKCSKKIVNFCKTFILIYENYNWDINLNGEKFLIKKISNLLNYNAIIFDVGAYNGEWTQAFLEYDKKFNFHLFEINKKKYKFLKKINLNIKVNNLGLGDKKISSAVFFKPKNAPDTASLCKNYYIKYNKDKNYVLEKCKVVTGDEYIKNNKVIGIDFLKIDTEGYEFQVLMGFKKNISLNKIKFIQFEYVREFYLRSKYTFFDIFNFLKKNNYKIFRIYPKKFELIKNYDLQLEYIRYANFLAATTINFNKLVKLK